MPVNRVIYHDFVDTTAVTYCFQPVPSGILRYYTITLLFKKKKREWTKVNIDLIISQERRHGVIAVSAQVRPPCRPARP